MIPRRLWAAGVALGWAWAWTWARGAVAQTPPPACSLHKKCPESAPCCSQYGQCGVGAFCLGGCDPRMSFALDSCTPEPVCQSKTYPMTSIDGIVDISKYLGDPKTADWVSQGEPVVYDGHVLLTMPPHSVGTVLASTTYMWYGNVKATLKTSRGAGVVTAFILLSDVKDEIDYEYVGTELDIAQTNYYFQGIPDYDNSANISLSDTYANFHTYEVQWTPDTITWLVDGKPGRVKKRSDTWNATSNQWDFPQTPARVQLSIWPGGAATNAPGTVQWAGGPIDWDNAPDIKQHGYYYATFGPVEVQCYKPETADGPGTNTGTSYTYKNAAALNDSVVDGDKPTALKSFSGTGTDMNAGETSNNNGTAATVPGATSGVGSHPGSADNGDSDGSGSGSGSGAGAGSGSGSGSATTPVPACATAGFSQNCGGNAATNGSRSDGVRRADRGLGSSAFAVVVGVAVLVMVMY